MDTKTKDYYDKLPQDQQKIINAIIKLLALEDYFNFSSFIENQLDIDLYRQMEDKDWVDRLEEEGRLLEQSLFIAKVSEITSSRPDIKEEIMKILEEMA